MITIVSHSTRRTAQPAAGGGGGGSDSEPTYNAGTQTLLFTDDLDSYTDFASVIAGGWHGRNAGTSQDTTTDAGGSNLVITGKNGTGKALRLAYHGVANAGGPPTDTQEVHHWYHSTTQAWVGGTTPDGDSLAGKNGHALYLSADIRMTGGGGFTEGDGTHRFQIKFMELWTTGGRSQFSPGPSLTYNVPILPGISGGLGFTFLGTNSPPNLGPTAGAHTTRWCQQVKAPWISHIQGGWNRYTIKLMHQSSAHAMDGEAMLWIDGTLVCACTPRHVRVAVPGAEDESATGRSGQPLVLGAPALWCEDVDLDGMFDDSNGSIRSIDFGDVNAASLWPFTMDIDNVSAWRD